MEKAKLGVSVGDDTEYLIQMILDDIEKDEQYQDDIVGQLDIKRELEESDGLAGEPITIGVLLAGGAIVISAVLRVVERILEQKQQLRMMKIVAEGFEKDPNLGKLLEGLANKYKDVSISYGLAKEAWKELE